jgi:ABC-type dipeptide/oligopeptide/nickel transport system permease component
LGGSLIARRLGVALISLLALLLLTAVVVQLMPGSAFGSEDPLELRLKQNLIEQGLQAWPLDLLLSRMRWSLTLGLCSLGALFLWLRIWSLAIYGSDRSRNFFLQLSLVGLSIPLIVLAPLAVQFFVMKLNWFPTSVIVSQKAWILPALLIAFRPSLKIARSFCVELNELVPGDTARAHRAWGFSDRQVVKKWLSKAAAWPALVVASQILPEMIGGVLVIEILFLVPGLGSLMVESIAQRNHLRACGAVLVTGIGVIVFQALLDVLALSINPRAQKK